MSNSRIVDADCHILEPPDIWKNHLGSKWQDKAPQARQGLRRRRRVAHRGRRRPRPDRARVDAGDAVRQVPLVRRHLRRSARRLLQRRRARSKDMDIDGVAAEILFPPQRTMSHFLGDDDEDFVLAGVEAYNNFLFDEFCAPDPKRLVGMAQIPSIGIDSAVDGAAQGQGARREGRADLELAGGQREPVDATTTRSGPRRSTRACPVTIHINIISREAAHGRRARRPPRGATSSTTCRPRRRGPRRSAA